MHTIYVKRLPHGEGLSLPFYATSGSAGADIAAAVSQDVTIAPNSREIIPTGFAIALPPHTELQIRSRSGLAFRHGVSVLNAPGTIDSDYRGEIKILLYNTSVEPFVISRGMRIAQLVLAPMIQGTWKEASTLPTAKERNEGGFGSTGLT